MKFIVLSMFPEMIPGPLQHSLAGKAMEKGMWSFEVVDIKNFGYGKHKSVDSIPYGGGAGMVMRPDTLSGAIEFAKTQYNSEEIIYFSPRGKPLTQSIVNNHSQVTKAIILICGRFEGIDQRVIDYYNIKEISIGDYILSGGEIAAITFMDACIRRIDGVISNSESLEGESFSESETGKALQHPLYTRPYNWNNIKVPEVLRCGNHKEIASWRKERGKEITRVMRPDLIKK